MIPYHGTPIGGKRQTAVEFMTGRHALIPFTYPDDLPVALEVCQSFVLDNGAFTNWQKSIKNGESFDWLSSGKFAEYVTWCMDVYRHPAFDWALIPDTIDGTEEENDHLLEIWNKQIRGVPVFHLHESAARLHRLVDGGLTGKWPAIAIGSSGQWKTPGTESWNRRMDEIMQVVCDAEGRPRVRLHGLRMLNPAVFTRYPFASADSTNAAQNSHGRRVYQPPTRGQQAVVIAQRIEAHQSAAVWTHSEQRELLFGEEFQLCSQGAAKE